MPISINNTTLTFNDATTQTTAATAYVGPSVQSFTASGTFTVPTGITKVKVSAIGGGGGGGGGGANGGNGGASSFGSSVIAGGGGGGGRGFDNGIECTNNPTAANGASTNIPYYYSNFSLVGYYGSGGTPGGSSGCGALGGAQGSNGVGYVTGLTPGASITITIGGGGAGGTGGTAGTAGSAGAIAIEW